MKAASPDLLHKSDLGLVQVGVDSDAGVRSAFDDIERRARRAVGRRGRFDGVLVCEQLSGGVEMVVGMSHDPLFGPVVTVGLGGVFVEVLGDVTFRVPPFGRDEAERTLHELRGLPLLLGARGAKPADIDALVDVMMKVQRLAMDLANDVGELDINPLLVRPRGAVALDALVVRK
jgi:acyl-CoA synthetase (NDP forming)